MKHLLLICCIAGSLFAAKPILKVQTYDLIGEVQELIGAEQYDAAKQKLDAYAPEVADRAYDTAYLETLYGYYYITQENYPEAIAAMRKAYDAGILDTQMQRNTLYNIAQLQLGTEDYAGCARSYEQWAEQTDTFESANHILYANALLQLKRFKEARKAVREAVRIAEAPTESHYQMLFYLNYELDDLPGAIAAVQSMIAHFAPKTNYWLQLAGLYLQQERYDNALAVMEIAYRERMLQREGDLMQLVHLYLYEGIPYRAAAVLEAGMRDEAIAATPEHYELLGHALYQAKELPRAVEAYTKAAERAEDGTRYAFLAKIYADLHRYDMVIETTRLALERGVDKKAELFFLRGLAFYEQKEILPAKKAFSEAARDPQWRERANQWIQYVTTENHP